MSTTFSANFGSFDSLNGRDRCGLRPCSFQTRCTVVWPTPISSANIRALQCVACLGFSLAVRVTIASRTSALIARLHQLDAIFMIFGASDRDKRLILQGRGLRKPL